MSSKDVSAESLIYPAVMIIVVGMHYLLLNSTQSIQWATYLPVAIGAVSIAFLEWQYPFRYEWYPDCTDIGHDLTFMLLVQVLLPRLLSFFVAVTLLAALNQNELTVNLGWPHEWSVVAQVVLMLLVADFFRYWLHRAAHEWAQPLWRLHAVHHSPKKLYWLNVGRFHPLEKSIQFLFDAFPFILLGVSAEVLALYFIFYSVNGFFQHCNVKLQLGPLNYIISGPELHRWHHSRIIAESNTNYGNNLIIWDTLFGTRYLPESHEVQELGLLNRNYPISFIAQMKTPFVSDLDQG
ncbi:MAG: sterol desaturase family protein [Burkholderiales bacterium]|nr:sterol desaturase family protein [Burkholderiales bacterium]